MPKPIACCAVCWAAGHYCPGTIQINERISLCRSCRDCEDCKKMSTQLPKDVQIASDEQR